MARIFNLRKDEFDARDHLAMRLVTPPPALVDMNARLGPVGDQGNAGACTGEAGEGFVCTLYNTFPDEFPTKIAGTTQFSALFLYAQERIKNGSFPADSGSDSRTIFKVLTQIGVCLESQDPYSDIAIGDTPTAEMIAAAAAFKIGAYHRVLFDDGLAIAKSVLASGYCRTIGIPVYQAIQSDEVAATGILPIPGQLETPIGGHELLVYGYDDTHEWELVRNSWSVAWGIDGNLRIPYGYYAAVGGNDTCDSFVGHMGKPWVPKSN